MSSEQPFSQAVLNEIFKISPRLADCVNSRESSSLEFKESFTWANVVDYGRTCAAFANTKGGHIVFGIANRPHRLVGLRQKALDAFEGLDPEKVSEFFNQHFAPEIRWNVQVHEVAEKQFGLLYVSECLEKPVVCTCGDSAAKLREGDIYYRYRGRTTRAKYPELRGILEQRQRDERALWLKHLLKIARVGVRDAGIFDLRTGQVSGAKGAFIIDESLLSQLAFIKEGEFSEIKGKPTLKLIGSAEIVTGTSRVSSSKQVIKSKGIRIPDIVLAFLDQQKVDDPVEYIRQICFESSSFMPVYYFLQQANLGVDAAISIVDTVVSREQAKGKLLGRLATRTTQQLPIPSSDSASARRKREYVDQANNGTISEKIAGPELKSCLQALRTLTPAEVRKRSKYLRALLRLWFNKHYASQDGVVAGNLRRAICWVDEALFMPKDPKEEG